MCTAHQAPGRRVPQFSYADNMEQFHFSIFQNKNFQITRDMKYSTFQGVAPLHPFRKNKTIRLGLGRVVFTACFFFFFFFFLQRSTAKLWSIGFLFLCCCCPRRLVLVAPRCCRRNPLLLPNWSPKKAVVVDWSPKVVTLVKTISMANEKKGPKSVRPNNGFLPKWRLRLTASCLVKTASPKPSCLLHWRQ